MYEDDDQKVGVINEKVTLETASFNINPVELIAKTKKLLSPEVSTCLTTFAVLKASMGKIWEILDIII